MEVSDHSDNQCSIFLRSLREGRWDIAENSLRELERVYHYAGSCPSWRGFHNLTHCLRHLIDEVTRSVDNLPNLIDIEEAYEPEKHPLPTKRRIDKNTQSIKVTDFLQFLPANGTSSYHPMLRIRMSNGKGIFNSRIRSIGMQKLISFTNGLIVDIDEIELVEEL